MKLKRSPGTPALAAPYQSNTSTRNLHIGTEFETAERESYEFACESHPIAATRDQNRCLHSRSRCNLPLPGGTGLQSLYSSCITSAPGQRPVQAAATVSWTIRSILAASQSLKSCQATIRKWCSFSIPRKPMETNAAFRCCGGYGECHCLQARSEWFSNPAASLQTFASTVLVRCRPGREAAIRDQRADQKAKSLVRRVGRPLGAFP